MQIHSVNVTVPLCISLLEGKSLSRSEHLYSKTATNTFSKGTLMIYTEDSLITAINFHKV